MQLDLYLPTRVRAALRSDSKLQVSSSWGFLSLPSPLMIPLQQFISQDELWGTWSSRQATSLPRVLALQVVLYPILSLYQSVWRVSRKAEEGCWQQHSSLGLVDPSPLCGGDSRSSWITAGVWWWQASRLENFGGIWSRVLGPAPRRVAESDLGVPWVWPGWQ